MRPHHLLPATLVLAAAVAAPRVADAAPYRCGTPALLPDLASRPPPPPPVLPGGPTKLTRDGFGGGHQVLESANFAVKWQSANLTIEQAQAVLDALEDGWALYIDQLGHTLPTGTATYRLNAYVSGPQDTPSIDFDGGYAWIDDDGYPYLVISAGVMDDGVEAIEHVATHELYHDVQLGLGAFETDAGYWFWEATAEWASQQLYPAYSRPYAFVGAYALTTELPLFLHGDPFGDPLAGVHQYGSSIFPRHVTDRTGVATLIPDVWEAGGSTDDPLVVLDGLLPDGTELDALFGDHAARMAVWDYPQRDLILPWVERYEEVYPEASRTVATVGPDGTAGLVPAPARALGGWGFHVIEIARPATGVVDVGIEVEAAGGGGSPATFHVTIVRDTADGPSYTAVPLTGGAGEASVTLPADEPTAWLAVAVTTDGRLPGETFDYQYRVGPGEPPGPGPDAGPEEPEVPEEEAGCCAVATGGGAPGGALALAAVVALALAGRRRR